jgi:hypothetical protein
VRGVEIVIVGSSVPLDRFGEDDYRRFSLRLRECLRALEVLLSDGGFGKGPASIGAELELSLVDGRGRALTVNEAVLRETRDPRFTVELDRFNIEFNALPEPLSGRPFSALREQLSTALERARHAAALHGGRVVAIGILPTLDREDLASSALTDTPRYRALAAGLKRMRRAPFHVRIDGQDSLDVLADDVTFEGANTSLQIHLRVDPERFAAFYNAAQLATTVALAASGNSPFFLQHRLWDETRIALFKQSVDHRPRIDTARTGIPRVCFGTRWLEGGALELFRESVELHAPLLPILDEEEPERALREGRVPGLRELRLHHGTVWRWNRAVFDPASGGHLRIELRALPSGPTIADMLANAAFVLGLTLGLAGEAQRLTRALAFEDVHASFYRAARSGLEAPLVWLGPGSPELVPARELVLALLPTAREGLLSNGVDASDVDPLLAIVAARCDVGRTGAAWQRMRLARLESSGKGRSEALRLLLDEYAERSADGEPVHRWSVEGGVAPRPVTAATATVEHLHVLPDPSAEGVGDSARRWLDMLPGPVWFRVPGADRSRTRAVVTLLHGNEPSGLSAVHAWLGSRTQPAVDMVFCIASTEAARAEPKHGHRTLPGHRDLNRCFKAPFTGPEGALARELLGLLEQTKPEALVDLHNNTGHNPAYGVGYVLDDAHLDLVALFASRYVLTDLPLGTLVEVATAWPSVVIECGRAGDAAADAVALAGLARFASLESLSLDEPQRAAVQVLRDPVRVTIRSGTHVGFAEAPLPAADLTLRHNLDRHNFSELPAGTEIGWVRGASVPPLEVRGGTGIRHPAELFTLDRGVLRTARRMIPIMMTLDVDMATSDCLFYAILGASDRRGSRSP